MRKLLVICGATGVGKTKLALQVAKKFGGELVSADSRQVYKKMDIGTGKDLPVDRKIWGYDLVDPKSEFSVSEYVKFAKKIIEDIWRRGELPILVGGTGFYVKALIDGGDSIGIPRDKNLRKDLAKKNVLELREMLLEIDSVRLDKMNQSDRENPRRLVRAIEIAGQKDLRSTIYDLRINPDKMLMIGLWMDQEKLNKVIEKRVEERLKMGFWEEVEKLVKEGVSFEMQSMQALGYRQYRDYFLRKIDREKFISEWIKGEQNYAKRQMVWFKKEGRIKWFDVLEENYPRNVINSINSNL